MAVKSKSTLLSEIAANINDNTAGDVTPADVRTRMEDMVDSMFPSKTWVQWTALGNNPPASGFATFDTVSDIAALVFSGTADNSGEFVGYVPEGATVSGGAVVRIAWSPQADTSGAVRFRARVRKLDSETESWSAWTGATSAGVANATDYLVTEITVAAGDLDGIAARDFFVLELGREVAHAGDTMTNGAQVAAVVMEGA